LIVDTLMKIILNNREEEIGKESITVNEMLILKKFSYKMRIIKINGDEVQMLYLMSGG